MELNPSDYIAAAALLISIASVHYTKKQSDQAKIASHNDYRGHLSEKHAAYRNALKQAKQKHKAEFSRLSAEAGAALRAVACAFDRYDTNQHATRPLRHLIDECSEAVYYAFKGQLGWQTGLNISHRFAQVIRVEDRPDPSVGSSYNSDFRSSFEQQYFKDPNAFQETELLSSAYFTNAVHQIKGRVEAANGGKLLLEIQEILRPFNDYLKEIQPRISDSAEQLEELLDDSELEHFPLDESPEIYRRLRYHKATYETLSHLNLHEVSSAYADRYYNFVSVSIYNCAILHAIQGWGSWGWNSGHRQR